MKTFLDFSRPVEVRFEEVDLASLAREVTDLMKPQARAAHIAIEFDPATDGEPTWIRGDPDMLKQAVLNLVTNALEAMRNGGNLRWRCCGQGVGPRWKSRTTAPASLRCCIKFSSCISPRRGLWYRPCDDLPGGAVA